MIEKLVQLIPSNLQNRSGKVFYSGRKAFSDHSPVYILGVNPGGTPEEHSDETVKSHTELAQHTFPDDWSAYRDESWKGKSPGKGGMQPRVLHLFDVLKLSPGSVPASNLVFVRSSRESTFEGDILQMAEICWPFHAKTIELIQPTVIVCLGSTAGDFVRSKIKAHNQIGQYVERNKRQWTSRLFSSSAGPAVAVLTHPSIANWCSQSSDPTGLVTEAIENAT